MVKKMVVPMQCASGPVDLDAHAMWEHLMFSHLLGDISGLCPFPPPPPPHMVLHISHFALPSPSPHRLSSRIAYAGPGLQTLFALVWTLVFIPILLLTACFPLSCHPPSGSSVTLVLSTSAHLTWFSRPAYSRPTFSRSHLPTLLIFVIPVPITSVIPCCELALPVSPCSWHVLSSTLAHNLRISLMPTQLPFLPTSHLTLPPCPPPTWPSPLSPHPPLQPHPRLPHLVRLGPREPSSPHPLRHPPLPLSSRVSQPILTLPSHSPHAFLTLHMRTLDYADIKTWMARENCARVLP